MLRRKIKFVDFKKQFEKDKNQIMPIIKRAFASGEYVGGKYIEILEKNYANTLKLNMHYA